MQKIICKKTYDTETSTLLKKVTFGNYGESDGYEESLYQTADGFYFLYVNGGASSKHPKEDILRMSKAKKAEFLGE